MKTTDEILQMLARGKEALQVRFKVRRLALFGSYARRQQQADSDVDIMVDVDPSIGLDFVTLAKSIEQLLGESVDLVSTRAIKPAYRSRIERESIDV
jgi:hypothetical protein